MNELEGVISDLINHGKIFPLIFVTALEPLKVRYSVKLPSQLKTKLDDNKSRFDLNFTGFRSSLGIELTYVIHPLQTRLFPAVISEIFSSLDDERVATFLQYPYNLFFPFARAVLSFEDKSYSITEFNQIIKEWRDSLEKIKLN